MEEWQVEHKARMSRQKEKREAYREAHKVELRRKLREGYQRLKQEVLSHYSISPPVCAHCRITDIDVLCIDHIANDGAEHRRIIGHNYGANFYRWLKKNNYPGGFQVLCRNCNWKKRIKKEDK